jgi:nitrate reductase beta subunit
MRSRLKGDNEGNPMVVCFNTCLDSIRTIPALQHDTDRMEDLDTEAEDHCADEWRYACMSRPYIPNLKKEVKKPDTGYAVRKSNLKMDDWVNY